MRTNKKSLNSIVIKDRYKLFNIFACPQCGSGDFSVRSFRESWNVCCNDCDHSPPTSMILKSVYEPVTPREEITFLRILFQEWNDGVSRERSAAKRKVMTRMIMEGA